MTDGEPTPGPPAHQLCGSNGKFSRLERLGLSGSFCSRNSSLYREPSLERSGKEPRSDGRRRRRPTTRAQCFLGKNCPEGCSRLSSKECLRGLPKRRRVFVAVRNTRTVADIYKKCQSAERKPWGHRAAPICPW
uniref:Uncharacterized protein n=1 Tax=Molossus molossus TaxID=27622 RepID=A0A7J8GKW8_MOLMO|nr:hypothetical protein HJG59_011489 [Molossus molossus]